MTEQFVKISDLKSLEEAEIENASIAMRELDADNVTKLSYVASSELPAIELANHANGLVVVGGYHRIASRKEALRRKVLLTGIDMSDDKAVNKALNQKDFTPEQETLFDTELPSLDIKANIKEYPSDNAIIMVAIADNLKHGLGLTGATRTKFGVYLWKLERAKMRESGINDKNPGYEKIATQVGIKRPTLYVAVQNMLKGETSEDTEDATEDENATNAKTLEKACKVFIASVNKFYASIGEIEDIDVQIAKIRSSVKDDTELDNLEDIGVLMVQTFLSTKGKTINAQWRERFNKMLEVAEKKAPVSKTEEAPVTPVKAKKEKVNKVPSEEAPVTA